MFILVEHHSLIAYVINFTKFMPHFTKAKILHLSEIHYENITVWISEDKELTSGGSRSAYVARWKHKEVSQYLKGSVLSQMILWLGSPGELSLVSF